MMDPDSSSDSNRDTPKELGEVITRPDTPGPMPTYHYPRDTLFELQFCPLAKKRPACLSEEFNTIDGLWDPDRWSRSFDTSRNNSPLTVGDRDKKRMEIQIERDYLMRRRPSDPKERLKEEKDGIVLSPQRRSFGTGCHVTQPTLTRQISCPSDFKDGSDRDRGPRRIGSGRIQLDRDRGEVTRERGGGERDFRAIRDRFDRDDRDRDRRYDREWEREGRDSRESRDPRDRGFRGGFDDRESRRDFGNRHFTSRDVRRKDFHQEDEPEWFTEGPISQQDTIELRGFEREKEKETPRQIKEVEEEDADESAQEEHKTGVADVADRNGSLETNEPSSPEESNHSDSMRTTSPHNNIFDFNEFFKIDNLPGLNQEGPVASADIPVVQSRFSQWFGAKPGGSLNSSRHNSRHNSHHNSRHNSRRSSLNDDFGYIVNDLLGGTRSPNVASPPPDQPMFDQSVFSPANSTFADKPQHHSIDFTGLQNKEAIAPMLSAIFQNNHEKHQLGSTSSNFSTQDAEIQLKALLFGKKDSTPSSGTASPGMGSPLNVPGRAKTVAELEADMNQRSSRLPARCFTPPQQPVPPPDMPQNFQRQPPTQPQQQQVPAHFQPPPPELSHTPQYQSPPGHQQMTPHNLPVQQQMHPQEMSPQEIQQQLHQHLQQQQQMQPQPLTPQQMQAHLAQQQHPSMPQVSIHQSAHSTPRGSQDEGDLTAFNKLLSLMKAGAAAAVESPPKIVGRPGQAVSPPPHMAQPPAPMSHPPMPPLTNSQAAAAAAQNEFFQASPFQALQRNKEQQLQIRHQTMNQMRIQQKPIPSQQLQTPPAQMSQPQGNQNNSGQPVNDPIINFIKQNPTIITKPASPTPPPQGTPQPPQTVSSMMGMMQTTSTPRAPSPSAGLMGQNLLSQPPSSPRIASPIMFGQQPPMHLSAPSPINPSQMGQSSSITVPAGTTLTSTATIRPPVVPRVPSPQELIAHTQAIMQTALLKKQLEDQRERFIRKQQDSVSYRAKSPNPMVSVKPAGPNVTQTPTMSLATSPACQTPKPSVSAAFTPTSVMKKMHSDKASEKEKQRQDNGEGENASDNGGPVKQLIQQDTSHTAVDNLELIQKMNIEQQAKENLPATIMTSMTTHCQPSSMPTSQFSNHDMNIPGINSIAASLAGHHDSVSLAEQLSQLSTPTSVQPKQQARALIGNGGFQGTPGQPVSGPVATPGRPIVKGITITSSSAVSSVMTPPMGRPMIGVPQMSTPQLQSKTVEGTPISLQTPSQPHLHRAITGAANPTSVPQVQTPVVPQQKQFSVSPSPLTRPIPPMGAQYGIPITGRIPVQQAMSPNPLLMQQMIQSGISPTAAARVNALNQLNQINHMNHLAMQQQQPRIMDPRLQGMRGVYPTVPNLTPRSSVIPTSLGVPVRTPMGVNVAIGRTVSPHPPTQKLINGPVSPGIPIHTSIPTSLLNGNNNITKQDPNLAKWFGTDVLKQQMTSLPPLPGSGQRMMTLEEIERCQQQAVIN
ncbi:eukaryotic translation initiation factor 4E transporter-like isoform X2 [Ylistrum balloti]|uniref:eukaryotic translation initiation factor 4E transporter-like isoform X2 n=1 Tax=Ylistrum balloti TaxID=509963 RepID=UPI002905ED3F|nr:eukaryotic translation initiation factor 4E transporter-like isoform X2 [Ylistrum balloti]